MALYSAKTNSEHIEDLIVRLRLLMQKKRLFGPVVRAMREAADTLELLIGNERVK